MHVTVEPSLLEQAVFHATRADGELAEAYQRAFAGCYREAAGERRDQAFAALHEEWFDRLGLRKRLLDCLSEFPNINHRISRFVAVDARARNRSGAELFGKDSRFALVLALTPAQLLDVAAFVEWARFELQHIEDMLNPEFGYDAAHRPGGTGPAQANLAHDRFVILWAISVDGRLHPCSASTDRAQQARYREFVRAFRVPDNETTHRVFQDHWVQFRKSPPTHASLVDWAEHGLPGLGHDASACADKGSPAPGGRCLLCGFSTFDWADPSIGPEVVVTAIQSDFPGWTPRQPICRRCEEVYRGSKRSSPMAAAASLHEIGA